MRKQGKAKGDAEQVAALLNKFDFALELAARDEEHYKHVRELLLSFIEVRDSLERFLSATEDDACRSSATAAGWLDSVRLIARQFDKVLQERGVMPMLCLNQQVEPGKHVIVSAEEVAGAEEDTIVRELVRGYEWDGEILRKPHVIVALSAGPKEKEN